MPMKTNVLIAMVLILLAPTLAMAQQPTPILLDGAKQGRVFEGIGALSAGASSRLLIDYPEPYRGQILDLLFKPGLGASFQHLKVEIGGDVNSTDGCEPSHMRTRDDENYHRGYEWWLMKEAHRRNLHMPLDCLAWGAPAWIGNGKFFSQDCADYMAKFLLGAEKVHGLDIAYIGIWNETAYDPNWIKLLRKTLDRNDLADVKIVGADQTNTWKIVDQMNADPELAKAVAVVGVHYAGIDNGPRKVFGKSTPAAIACGKPLWASEDGPWRGDWTGAKLLARMYNLNYIHGRMTKSIIWSLVTSYYDNLPLHGSGVLKANTPWSGHFEMQPALWATAHTTQFVHPGWKYLDGAACGLLPAGGSYVTLKSPEAGDYSLIIETTEATAREQATFTLAGGLSTSPLHVWRSNAQQQFIRQSDITPRNNTFTLTLDPGCIYSLTTTRGQTKGSFTPPPPATFPAPYADDFESYPPGAMPRYFSDQGGIFEVAERADGKGKCLRQVILSRGIEWPHHPNPCPETFLGDLGWENYQVSADVRIERAGFISLFGRVGKVPQALGNRPPQGYWLRVYDSGVWELNTDMRTLACGRVGFSADTWHNLKLRFRDKTISVLIDNKPVTQVEDDAYRFGMAGLGCGWHAAEFDNFSIQADEKPRNLALWKPARASSQWLPTKPVWVEADLYDATLVTDGYPGLTRWSAAKDALRDQWIEIDLGQELTFGRTLIRQYEDRIAAYRIQYWDGAKWADACSGDDMGGPQRVDTFPPVKSSKVRLHISKVKGALPASIYELEVYER